jgi:predicted porin
LALRKKNPEEIFQMQKKLIALAVAAAFSAPAFADVTVYGIVDAAVANISATGMKSDLTVLSGGLSTSRIGVVAAEDLDNGMKAIVKVEYKLDSALSDGVLTARQEMLALAGGFGTVAAGYLQTTGYDWAVKFDPTTGSAVDSLSVVNSGFLIGSTAGAARANRALAYISPDMGGVTVAVNYSANVGNTGMVLSGATTGNKTTATLLSATYNGGPLAIGGVYAATANDNTGYNKTSDMALGASYDLSVVKLLGTYQTSKVDGGGNTDKAMSFSAVAPVGPGALVATVAKNTIASTVAEDNTTAFTVAYLQGLSKTTTAYGAVQKISLKAATTTDTTIIAIGLKKVF